ncbi:hypothetical protein ASD24_03880 [Paenibacillus sp. Root52]|uniref:outer membrane protein assembly factor BamB family protein n=1 Tax=Paenibacillus sp. Root52 TaxID=1736552 RepID=UPI0006FCA577|nr:PQQ-binding-like beta-propeller repeat protein [Paenibacillus sp. Root52]KQY94692.1 hypothetical protein ASD24_03880 [Paenibacillus sp. Root52]
MSNKQNHRMNSFRQTGLIKPVMAGVTAAMFAACGVLGVLPTQAQAEATDISVRNWHSYNSYSVPEVKVSWSAKVDNYLKMNEAYLEGSAIAEEGKVFTFVGSKLVALDAKTGKQLWTYGKKLTPFITYKDGTLYGLSADHKPYALTAKTGKVKWQSGTTTSIDAMLRTEALIPKTDTFYVINGSTTFAFDMKSGKLRWKANEPLGEGNGTTYLEESDGVVLRTFNVQGALSSIQLNAYDKKTGKKLWSEFGQGEALQVKGGLVYSIDYYSPMLEEYDSNPNRTWKVNVYNLKTGVLKGSQEYSWKMAGEPPYANGRGSILANQDKLYIEQGDKIAEYSLNAYKKGEAPLRTLQQPQGDNLELIGIVQERLIYKNYTTGELTGIKLANGQEVKWLGDAPLSQLDVYGKGMYRAQRNGTLLGIDMLSAKPLFRAATGGDLHHRTLKTNGMLIIQTEGKILGVKLPAALK